MHEQIQKILEDKIQKPSFWLEKRILPLLEEQKPIKSLNLLGMKIDWCDLLIVLKIIKTIKTNLEFLALRGNQYLEDEDLLPIIKNLQEVSTLQSLYFDVKQLGQSGLAVLEQLISTHPNLKSIHIDIDNLDDAGVCLLTNAIKQNSHLISVYIAGKQFYHQGTQALINLFDSDKFESGGFECSTLEENDQSALAETIEMLKNMTSLVLGFEKLPNLNIITDAIRKNQYLQKVRITTPEFQNNAALQQEIENICKQNQERSQEKHSSNYIPNCPR